MIDLADKTGLPLMIDENTGTLIYDKCVECQREQEVSINEIVPALLNKFLKYPEKVYKEYNSLFNGEDKAYYENKHVNFDVINLPFGLLGIEFIKTHIYFSDYQKSKFACVVQVVMGELTVFIQKNRDEDPSSFYSYVDSVEIIRMSEGDTLVIPTGCYYTFVNASNQKAIFAIICSTGRTIVNYSALNQGKGLAYYIISKNGKAEIVANPKYKCDNPPTYVDWSKAEENLRSKYDVIENVGVDFEGTLYEIFKRKLDDLKVVLA